MASTIKFIILLAFLLGIQFPAIAGQVLQEPPGYYDPGYTGGTYANNSCVQTKTVLFEGKQYECKAEATGRDFINDLDPEHDLQRSKITWKNSCWNYFAAGTPGNYLPTGVNEGIETDGLTLDRKIEVFFDAGTIAPHVDYAHPCKIKPIEQCDSVDIPAMVRGAFAHKFPYDILGDNPFQGRVPQCPQIRIMDQTFAGCYLLDLVKNLKYPLLLIFVFGALTRL